MATSFPSFASFSISHRSFSSPVHILHHSPSLLSLLSSTLFRNCIAYVILDLRSASSLYPLPFSLYLHLLRYIHLIHYLHRLRLLQILRYIFLLHSLCFSDTPPLSLLSPFCLNFAVLLSLFFGSFFLFVTFTFVSSPSSIFASFVVTGGLSLFSFSPLPSALHCLPFSFCSICLPSHQPVILDSLLHFHGQHRTMTSYKNSSGLRASISVILSVCLCLHLYLF